MAGSFSVDISRFAQKAGASMDLVVRKVALDLLSAIVMRTPVLTGRARGSWAVGLYTLPEGASEALDKAGGATVAKGAGTIQRARAGRGSVFVTSNLAYMPALEYGHSKQAPQGMVRLAVRQYQKMVKKAVGEAR